MTETAAPVVNHPCDRCDKQDDHPMTHVAGVWKKNERTQVQDPSFHFDCLPQEYVDLLHVGGEPLPQHAKTWALREAALAGTHGADLTRLAHELPSDNDVEPEGHEVVPGMGVAPKTNVEA